MRVMITGGGTGGHIYPALAICRGIMSSDGQHEVLYVGTAHGLEREIVPRAGFEFVFIHVEGLRRSLSLRTVKTAWLALSSIFAARRLVRKFRPDIVVGTGGFVVAPVIFAAHMVGVKTAIIELDAHPGLANRLVYRLADSVMLAFAAGAPAFAKAKRVVITGNPRATEVVAVTKEAKRQTTMALNLNQSMPTVVIVSGSRGASPINQAVSDWLMAFTVKQFQVVWITGQVHFEEMQARFSDGVHTLVRMIPFYHDMPALLAQASLLVSRAGGTTLAEVTALGVPSILIPSPYVTNHHQDKNAAALVDGGAALLLPEEQLSGATLGALVERLLGNPFRLESMGTASRKLGRPDALERILQEMRWLAGKHV